MGEYLSRLRKNTETLRAGTDKTDKTRERALFVSFVGTPVGASGKNTHPEPPLPVTLEWLRGQGCYVLPEDVSFIAAHLPRGTRGRNTTLRAYVTAWLDAMEREPLEHRRDNRGRLVANTALREGKLTEGARHNTMDGEPHTRLPSK